MKLLAIVGSPRLNGNTNYLVDVALAEAARLGAETEKVVLSQHRVDPCMGHADCASVEFCRQLDDGEWILDRFCEADGVILATPVYYYNVSAWMKAFMDRNYFLYKRGRKSQARAVGIIIVAEVEGIEDTFHTLKQFVGEFFRVGDGQVFLVCGYAGGPGDARGDAALGEAARNLGRQMVETLAGGASPRGQPPPKSQG